MSWCIAKPIKRYASSKDLACFFGCRGPKPSLGVHIILWVFFLCDGSISFFQHYSITCTCTFLPQLLFFLFCFLIKLFLQIYFSIVLTFINNVSVYMLKRFKIYIIENIVSIFIPFVQPFIELPEKRKEKKMPKAEKQKKNNKKKKKKKKCTEPDTNRGPLNHDSRWRILIEIKRNTNFL